MKKTFFILIFPFLLFCSQFSNATNKYGTIASNQALFDLSVYISNSVFNIQNLNLNSNSKQIINEVSKRCLICHKKNELKNPNFILKALQKNDKNHKVSKEFINLHLTLSKDISIKQNNITKSYNFSNLNFYNKKRDLNLDFTNTASLEEHAKNHGYYSAIKYLNDARKFLDNHTSPTTQSFYSKMGWFFKYDFKTNEFGIINQYGGISTYFKPDKKINYWFNQIEIYGIKK